MFGEPGNDRRQSYSFKQHFQRAVATKGLRRLLVPMVGTAIVASVAFAYCGADGITGPSGGSNGGSKAGLSASTSASSSVGGNGTTVTPFPVTEEEIPMTIAEVEVPTDMQPTTCNGDIVAWEEARTRGGGVLYFNPRTMATRVVIKINQHAKGPGMQSTTNPAFPKRYYNGWQDYERESYMAPGVSEIEEEYDLHIIARAENETRALPDDYMLRVKVRMRFGSNGAMTMEPPRTSLKCF
jgi:hypothetical protein